MDPLQRKKIGRSALRNHAKKLQGDVNALLDNFPDDGMKQLAALKQNFVAQLEKIETACGEVAALIDVEADLVKDIEESCVANDVYFETLVKIDQKLNQTDDKTSVKKSSSTSSVVSPAVSTTKEVKLPRIELKSFDGDILNWQTFWDQFESSVHSKTSLSDVDKFSYLKSLLDGPAGDCIAGLKLTSDNYKEAVDLLKSRFGNTQLLINRYAESFDELKCVRSMNQVSELRNMYDRVEATVRNLRSMKIDANTYGAFLVPLLSKKLPQELKRILSRHFKDQVWDFTILMTLFKDELEAQERISLESTASGLDEDFSTMNLHTGGNGGNPKPRKSKPSRKNQGSNNNAINCVYCNGNHVPGRCSNVTDIKIRRSTLKRKGLCYICFQRGHVGQNCTLQYQCNKCGGRHHISICDQNQGNRLSSSNSTNPPSDQNNTTNIPTYLNPPNFSQFGWVPPPQHSVSHFTMQPNFQANSGVMSSPVNSLVRPPDPTVNPIIPAPAVTQYVPIYSANSSIPSPCATPFVPTTSCSSTNHEKSVLLCTGRGNVFHDRDVSKTETVRFLFDDGSMDTFITQALKEKLNLPIVYQKPCSVSGFGGVTTELNEKSDVVQLQVASFFGKPVAIEAIVVPVVCGPLPRQRPKSAKMNYPHLMNLFLSDFSDDPSMEVDILVGGDFYWSFMTGRIIKGPEPQSPSALETTIGWVLSGPNKFSPRADSHSLVTVSLNTAVSFDEDIKKFWEIEESPSSVDEVMEKFKSEVSFNGKRYVVKLPFKSEHDFLPDNRRMCERRLNNLCKQFEKKPEQFKLYDQIFVDYQKEGIIEEVPPEEVGEAGKVCYLSHRPIVREDRETTKIRPVFDASAKASAESPSLNDILHSGPNLLALIYDVLLRFTLRKIVVMSDIKQAFLNVEIHPDHIDYLRFLWRKDGSTDTITVFRFLVVLFGLTPSPFLLLATIQHHCQLMVDDGKMDQEFVSRFLKTLYMDDNINGGEDVDDAFLCYKKSKYLMETAGFLLRKWCSNDKNVMKLIKAAEAGDSDDVAGSILSKITSVLGLQWDTEADEIIFDFVKIIHTMHLNEATKRVVLSVVASFFDPLGFLSPITSQGKVIFQLICKSKLKWDDLISSEILDMWNKFIKLITEIKKIRFKRCVVPELIEKIIDIQVHGFSDSSGSAYCAVVYLRKETTCGVAVRFLTAKTKVAPVKKFTIPRLELLSCVLLSKLIKTISSPLADWEYGKSVTCWNDSTSALGWILFEKDRGPWVQHRTRSIREIVPAKNWRHVPGVANPADIATREISAEAMSPDSIWFTGPKFLYDTPDKWPTHSIDENDVLPDQKIKEKSAVHVTIPENRFGFVLEVEKYSSLHRLYMVTAYVMRFKNNMIASIRSRTLAGHVKLSGNISTSEYRDAEKEIIRFEQFHIKKSDKFNLWKKSLNLFFDDDGILRLKGRLENSSLKFNEKFPILLRDSHFLKLQILKSHVEVWHDRTKPTLARLRTKYWVVRGRQIVKRTIAPCVTCKRHLQGGLCPPPTPQLPEHRVNTAYSFQTTGVDYAGPLHVKSIYGSSTVMNKAYICLFTCATSRAIHLELTPNLEADSFLRTLKRFFSRRGTPGLLIDDNAQTFKSKIVKNFLMKNNIEHSPILPAAPWWGGFYERLVRSVKTPLKKVVGKAKLNYEEMETVLVEIEALINSRPLTYLYEDDVSEPLTPSHLLAGRNLASPPSSPSLVDCDSQMLTRRFRYLRCTLRILWRQFRHEYLTELREHHMHCSRKSVDVSKLRVGDVVIIRDDGVKHRSAWRLGRIESLVVGRDAHVRGALLNTVSELGRPTKMKRPVQKLIPLEVSD